MEIKNDREYKKSTRVQDVFCESGTEYILPDYNPDVRKILFSSATLRPSGRFASSDEVNFGGTVVYDVIYADSENRLSSVSFTSDYDLEVKCSADSYVDCYGETRLSNLSIRLVGPRKFSAKASVMLMPRLVERVALPLDTDKISGSETPEINTSTVAIHTAIVSGDVEREYAERIATLEGAIADEVNVIYTDAEAVADGINVGEGSVTVSGNLRIISVIQNGDEPAYLVEKNIPIEENVPFPEVRDDMKLTPEAVVTSLRTNLNTTDEGVEVVVSVLVNLYAIGELNERVEIVTDAYMKGRESEVTASRFGYAELISVTRAEDSVTAEMDRSSLECAAIKDLSILSSEARVTSVSESARGALIEGEVKYSGFASCAFEDGTSGYLPVKLSCPFKREINTGNSEPGLRYEVKVRSHSPSAELDAGKIYARSSLTLKLTAEKDGELSALTGINPGEEKAAPVSSSRIVVYYPSEGETLFSVAKKFRTTTEKLALDNSITEAVSGGNGKNMSLSSVKRLIIM